MTSSVGPKRLEGIDAEVGQRKAKPTRNKHSLFPETSKLEIPTKKRVMLLSEESKYAEFLGGAAG
ncbi:hypothetical protein [Mesobacillus harenae]|uniref:hypothetical protein n=1 Tax=Mesobacillus harenae TaxID=2213203 RepID=UPI0015810970|nr:hypothetical protein [Mesobacillus harenae]